MSGADAFASVQAQAPAVETLRAAITRDKLASSYLFEGPSGTGKGKAALALAEAVIARSTPEGLHAELGRRIASGTHPDVRIFTPRAEGNRNLQVEVVRNEVLPFAQFAPFESKAAFVIFPDADVSFPEQHPEAANAMLKTLEEPRPGVYFVLLSARPDRLLQTIRSRCQRVRFRRLPDDVLSNILAEQGVPEASRVVAVALADGRADKALAVGRVGDDGRSAADLLFELALRTDEIAADGRPGAVVSMAEELSRSADLAGVLEALTAYYRDVARAALGMPDDALAFRHQAERIRLRAGEVGARHAADAVAGLREVEELIAVNANKDLALADWLFSIGREPMPPRARKRPR